MLQSPQPVSRRVLERFVERQAFVVEKLERDGYACEVRAARRMLKSFESELAAARRRRNTARRE